MVAERRNQGRQTGKKWQCKCAFTFGIYHQIMLEIRKIKILIFLKYFWNWMDYQSLKKNN